MDVPPRNTSVARREIGKIPTSQLFDAKTLQKVCNKAQKTRDAESSEPNLWLSQRSRLLEQVQNLDHVDLHPVHAEWTLRQCFCVITGGLVLQTQGQWIYKILPRDMKPLIQAGMIHCSDFRDQDIEDRSKADSFAKFFTVLQSTWFLCNIIIRWANDLPVSPIELSTIGYVACAILIYGVWWYKPKDMGTYIAVHLRYDRDDIPIEVRDTIEENSTRWVHVRALVKEDNWVSVLWKTIRTPLFRRDIECFKTINEEGGGGLVTTPFENFIFDVICSLAALLYCGIHVAAWNFPFATRAELISWRVFSLASTATIIVISFVGSLMDAALLPNAKDVLPSFMVGLTRPAGHWATLVTIIVSFNFYIIARLGIMGLVFSSLRALPTGSYTTIQKKSRRIIVFAQKHAFDGYQDNAFFPPRFRSVIDEDLNGTFGLYHRDDDITNSGDASYAGVDDKSAAPPLYKPDISYLKEIARHLIHINEAFLVAGDTLESMMHHHENFVHGYDRTRRIETSEARQKLYSQIQERLYITNKEIRAMKFRASTLTERLENEIDLYNHQLSIVIAETTRRDNATMKALTLIGVLYLPGTFISGIFGSNFFDYSPGSDGPDWNMSSKFWIYWAVTIPLTILTFLGWVVPGYMIKLWRQVVAMWRLISSTLSSPRQAIVHTEAKMPQV
ncbi:hypothetical protein PISL3812_06521 [Talaromyces islandicus]|uniref:Uncharacterized protein n=1 Tax=Talaromyces islandicus TaxID=28573 RepID=A0A0U1M1P1_TALIS|nr:hypothetical protein PISL3812_06521 [Talaromyces islandicus]